MRATPHHHTTSSNPSITLSFESTLTLSSDRYQQTVIKHVYCVLYNKFDVKLGTHIEIVGKILHQASKVESLHVLSATEPKDQSKQSVTKII